jgi:putative ABC transport system permease protein
MPHPSDSPGNPVLPAVSPSDDRRRFGWIEDALSDARFYVRSLTQRGNRGFAAVAILTLALGIGSATAIFSVGYGLLNNAFPYEDADEIWSPWINFPPNANNNVTRLPLNLVKKMPELPGVAEVMYSTRTNFNPGTATLFLEVANVPNNRQVYASVLMSPNAFSFLGVPPLKGRWLGPQDLLPDGSPAPVVVLSEQAWKKFFPDGSDPIGKPVPFLDSRGQPAPKTVVGVMPARFGGAPVYDIGNTVWLPLPDTKVIPAQQLTNFSVRPRLRLKPGVTKEVAQQQLAMMVQDWARDNQVNPFWIQQFPTPVGGGPIQITAAMINSIPRTLRDFRTSLRDMVSSTFDPEGLLRTNIRFLYIGVGFLLLIACINVANLQLSRAASRTREISVRLALGAQRSRLVRQLLTESVILALAGAGLGILVAYGFTQMTTALMPPNMFSGAPLPEEARIGLDGTVLGFAALIAIVSGLLFGLAPALQSTRLDLNTALKDGGRSGAGAVGGRLRSVLVIGEMAFAIVLLVAASLTLWGYMRLVRVDPGYNPDRLYQLSAVGIPSRDPRMDELISQMKNLPSIEDAARVFNLNQSSRYTLEGLSKDEAKWVRTAGVDANFLRSYGMTLVRGREFTTQEVARGELLAIVGTTGGNTLWPAGEDPIGRKIALDILAVNTPPPAGSPPGTAPTPGEPPTLTIIGVVNNLRPNVTVEPTPFVIFPHTLRPQSQVNQFMVRMREGQTANLQVEMGKLVRTVQANATVGVANDLDAAFDQQFQLPRFNFVLFCTLAVIALTLAIAGIYSVLSYHISQRTKEFGVRLALGADRGNILRLVLRGGGLLLGIGVVVGIAASAGLAKVASSQTRIFTVNLDDTAALLVTLAGLVLLCFAAFLACLIPARRATRVDPLVALRAE